MADFYMDTDAGSDANNGTTWALGKLTLEGLLAVMSAGDTGFIQGSAADTAAASRTFTLPGTLLNPCRIIGVVDGTTNEGASIVAGDLAVTLPLIETTGSNPITVSNSATWSNINILSGHDLSLTDSGGVCEYINCELSSDADINVFTGAKITLTGSSLDLPGDQIRGSGGVFEMFGGIIIFTGATHLIRSSGSGKMSFQGVDISGLPSSQPIVSGTLSLDVKLINCSLPSTFSLVGVEVAGTNSSIEVIASNDASSLASTASIRDYQYEDPHGTIEAEFTVVRTDGADDDASGAFAYAMTAKSDATLESTTANLKSPWMAVWIDGGTSKTLTVFIANDTASTDYLEDEAWCEFYTPDAGDTAQHDQNFDAADARKLNSSTAITDDTGSTWGAGGNNHQKFSATVTPGYEGFAYARVRLAKRQSTPDTLYLDPKIVVT